MNPNYYYNQKLRFIKRKYEIILKMGGKCSKCGYSENIGALEFHHLDPSKKETPLDARHIANSSLEKLEEELSKCILVCANCHRELHYPDLFIDNVKNMSPKINKKSYSRPTGSICPICGRRFPRVTGKTFCSKECYFKSKNYPSVEELNDSYKELKSWEKVAKKFGISRRVTQGIRNRSFRISG